MRISLGLAFCATSATALLDYSYDVVDAVIASRTPDVYIYAILDPALMYNSTMGYTDDDIFLYNAAAEELIGAKITDIQWWAGYDGYGDLTTNYLD